MTAFLKLYPPRRSQYRSPRRATPTGCIVIHTAETAPDFAPPDTAAERTAEFIRGRSDAGSYHLIVDSDTIIQLVEFRDEAYHDGTGSNRWSIGISVATRAADWESAPGWWVDATINNLAEAAARSHRWLIGNNHPGCPPVRITKTESDNGASGFISHAERDPQRRTDPGEEFPWDQFLTRFADLTGQKPTPPTNGDDMADPHTQAAAATLAISQVYETHAGRPIESADAYTYHLNMYLASDTPARYLSQLAATLENERPG